MNLYKGWIFHIGPLYVSKIMNRTYWEISFNVPYALESILIVYQMKTIFQFLKINFFQVLRNQGEDLNEPNVDDQVVRDEPPENEPEPELDQQAEPQPEEPAVDHPVENQPEHDQPGDNNQDHPNYDNIKEDRRKFLLSHYIGLKHLHCLKQVSVGAL